MTYVIRWCVESILSFCDTCRREGRLWAKDGYGFSATKGIEHNVKQHKNIITHARYIHFFSGGKKVSPVHFSHAWYADFDLIDSPNGLRKPRDPENLSRTVLHGRGFACKTNACSPSALL